MHLAAILTCDECEITEHMKVTGLLMRRGTAMSEKMRATEFHRDEAQIKQDWLCLLIKDENAPLDVTYKANLIKIQKEYHPSD